MSAITNWQFSISGLGSVGLFTAGFYYAGGVAVIGFGGSNGFNVYNLGGGNVAIMISAVDQNNEVHDWYWNSHYGNDADVTGMMVWNDQDDGYQSSSVGPEQTFTLLNLGQGNIALKATGGAFTGQYLSGVQGGWYTQDGWNLGTGSFVAVGSPAPIQVSGDMLPILIITNSGYQLDLQNRDLGTLPLADANMQQCQLNGADLSQVAGWQGADFTQAVLRGANLAGQSLAGATWNQADFTGTDLTSIAGAQNAQLSNAVFDGGQLGKVSFAGATLDGASFRGADLTGTDLTGATLTGADFTNATLDGTVFSGAQLQGTHFDGADLSTAVFDPQPEFERSATGRTTFVGATIPFPVLNSDWSWLDLTDATITGIPTSISGLVADGALLPDGVDLQNVDLSGASFVGTQMYQAQLEGANLRNANLSTALLKGARLNAANLTGANLDSAWLIAEQPASQAMTPDTVADMEPAVAAGAYLFNTALDGAHCDGVDFSGAFFVTASALGSQPASAVGASMNFCKFNQAWTVLASFNGAQLSAANFANAHLQGATFLDNGGTAAQLTPSSDVTHTPASVFEAEIQGVDFTGANMDGLDMRSAVFSTAPGLFEKEFDGYGGEKVPVSFQYQATVLGNTTPTTTCPDGSNGPCSLSSSIALSAAAAAALARPAGQVEPSGA